MANLSTVDFRYIERFGAVGTDKAEINGRRGLQFHLQELMGNIREPTVITVVVITEGLTDQAVKISTPVALLVSTGIWKYLIYERLQTPEQIVNGYQFTDGRVVDRAGESLQVDAAPDK